MKKWNTPSIEELDVTATAYSPDGGSNVDGSYISRDGKYTYNTFAPSSGNSGKPSPTTVD